MADKIVEIKVRKVSELSEIAKKQVLAEAVSKGEHFRFSGYAKLTYASASPLRIIKIEPIEGNANEQFDKELEELGITD